MDTIVKYFTEVGWVAGSGYKTLWEGRSHSRCDCWQTFRASWSYYTGNI